MAFSATIDINGTPTAVTVVDVNVNGSSIYVTYILTSTQEVFVLHVPRHLPGNPTKIADGGVNIP